MSLNTLLLSLLGLAVVAFLVGFARAKIMADGKERTLHSRPGYHGGYLALWTSLPAFIVLLDLGCYRSRVSSMHRSRRPCPRKCCKGRKRRSGLR